MLSTPLHLSIFDEYRGTKEKKAIFSLLSMENQKLKMDQCHVKITYQIYIRLRRKKDTESKYLAEKRDYSAETEKNRFPLFYSENPNSYETKKKIC